MNDSNAALREEARRLKALADAVGREIAATEIKLAMLGVASR